MKLNRIVILVIIITSGCSPKWMSYDWCSWKNKKDFCLLEQSSSAHKDSLGIIIPDKYIDTLKWSEQICIQKINKNEGTTSYYNNDSLILKLYQQKTRRKEIKTWTLNGSKDTISYGLTYLTKFGTIQKNFDLSGHS